MQPKQWINNGVHSFGPRHFLFLFPYIVWRIKSVHLRDILYAPDDAVDMECHISVVDHKTTRLCIALSAHGSTRAKCIRSNGRIQIRSNTKNTRTDEIQIHRSSYMGECDNVHNEDEKEKTRWRVPAPMHTRNTCDFDWVDRIRTRLRKPCSHDKNVTLMQIKAD